jgi:hypothetical protein
MSFRPKWRNLCYLLPVACASTAGLRAASPFARKRERVRVFSWIIPKALDVQKPLTLILSPSSRGEAKKATPNRAGISQQFAEHDKTI